MPTLWCNSRSSRDVYTQMGLPDSFVTAGQGPRITKRRYPWPTGKVKSSTGSAIA